jgi:6-phosphofructokinase 1
MALRRVAVNTGGGDAPGLNAALRAVALGAEQRGIEVYGITRGYAGLLSDAPGSVIRLDREAVRGIHHLGGTILGSTNRGDPFRYPVEQGGRVVPVDVSARVIERLAELGCGTLIAIGGDGSLRIAARLLERGLPRVIAVPKTIDNDICGTDQTFGFDSAIATATDALDKLHSTAQAHERVMVVELMGRYAGWIALYAGIAGGADVILIPEIPFALECVVEKLKQREALGRKFAIVVAAEGAREREGALIVQQPNDGFRELRLGGIAERLAQRIEALTGKESRSIVLGHLQRGGSPVMTDRILATRVGAAAARFLVETEQSGLVALRGQNIELVPLEIATAGPRLVPLDSDVLQTARELGVCFGDEPQGAFRV